MLSPITWHSERKLSGFGCGRQQAISELNHGVPNGLKYPPTPPSDSPSDLNGLIPTLSPEPQENLDIYSDNSGMVKSLDAGVFAIPPVPRAKKINGKKFGLVNGDLEKGGEEFADFIDDELSDIPATSDVVPPACYPRLNGEVSNETKEGDVTKMISAIAGIVRRNTEDRLIAIQDRFMRLNSYHVNRAVENDLRTSTSSFHDFLNRESYRSEPGTSSKQQPESSRSSARSAKEATRLLSAKDGESSLSDLASSFMASKEEMRNKTPSQLVEFVKRVESNQRREAFEKQQRPTYLLKLASAQSSERALSYTTASQNLQKALDRFYSDDPYVTDSSSGGESADEAEEESFQQSVDKERSIPIEHRALFRFAQERTAIASRYGHAVRQLARLEYGSQVVTGLLQKVQKKQGVAAFGAVSDEGKPTLKQPINLSSDASSPRPWDDREVVAVDKTTNAVTLMRVPADSTSSSSSLHPLASSTVRKRFKVAAPVSGLTYPFETYEASMWKDRLCAGKATATASDLEETAVDEDMVDETREPREHAEAVSASSICAKTRPLVSFTKRAHVPVSGFPPPRIQAEDASHLCTCFDRSLMPDQLGSFGCAHCLGQKALPVWTSKLAASRATADERIASVDGFYHRLYSQPSNRSLDAELGAVSMDFDPAELALKTEPIKKRISSRLKRVTSAQAEADFILSMQAQERASRMDPFRYPDSESINRDEQPRGKGKRSKASGLSKGKGKGRITKSKAGASRKRRHSSVSSDSTETSSRLSMLSRSTSLNSLEAGKPGSSKRGPTNRTNSTVSKSGRKKDAERDAGFVIPYGISLPQKIEKIQYKEIVVPKFRDLKEPSQEPDAIVEVVPGEPEELSDEELDDAIFARRHAICEVDERARFNVPEKTVRKRNKNEKNQRKNTETQPVDDATNSNPAAEMVEGADERNRPAKKRSYKKSSKSSSRNKKRRKDSNHPLPDVVGDIFTQESKPKSSKRPRKSAEEMAALCAKKAPRPMRTRRSTLRGSPDERAES